jgi:hypothetical protein
MARRPGSRSAEVKALESKLALRALIRQERRREAAAQRSKDWRDVSLGIASPDTVRRVFNKRFPDH